MYRVQDNYNREDIYIQIDDTDSFPITVSLYDNELIELNPFENPERVAYSSKSPDKTISLDSLAQFFRYKSPLQITDYDLYIVQENSNGEKRTIPVKLAYLLVD